MTVKRALIVVGVAAAAVVAVLLWPRLAPGGSAPDPVARAQAPQGTVLMIPGYGGGEAPFAPLAAELRNGGIRSEVIDVGDGTGDLKGYAALVIDEARALMRRGEPAPDLIGYSAGGLTARIAETEHPELFRKVITIGTPHAGTETADFGAMFGECPPACQQMRPGSEFLASLPMPAEPQDWLSIWSGSDEVIRPASSSELPEVTNYELQYVCDRNVDHRQLVGNSQTMAAVAAFLGYQRMPTTCT